MNVNFNIMLSLGIKGHAFIPYKNAFLQEENFSKEEGTLFC